MKLLEIHLDNLTDFSSFSTSHLGSRTPVQVGIKEKYLLKRSLFYWY